MSSWRFLLTPRWIIGFLLVIVFAIACHFLSQWQLARRAQAQAEIHRIEVNYDAAPIPVADALVGLDSYSAEQKWLPVTLTGAYMPAAEVLVRNRPCAGSSGYDVVTPFQLSTGETFWVDRGCVAAGSEANTAATYRPAPDGAQTIVVRLRASEPSVTGREDQGATVGSINVSSLAPRVPGNSYTAAYGQLAEPTQRSAPFTPARPDPDEGPHLSYALQWYVFAVIAVVAYGWAARNERRNRLADGRASSAAPRSDSAPDQQGHESVSATSDATLSLRYGQSGAGGRRRPAARRISVDAELEDTLIDAGSVHPEEERPA